MQRRQTTEYIGGSIITTGLIVFSLAWATHVGWWIDKLQDEHVSDNEAAFGLLATVAVPLGIGHGIMIWFGEGM